MSFATVLVHVDADRESNDRIKFAADLAKRFRSHLIGISGCAIRPPLAVQGVVFHPGPTEQLLQDTKLLLDQRAAQFHAVLSNLSFEWRSFLDFPTEAVAREARSADLIVIGRDRSPMDPYRSLDPGSLLLKAGRPVLIVPHGVTSFSPKRVAIAWKDVREARRAVYDALPILHEAESVMIVEVSEGGDGKQALHHVRDVARYLTWHRTDIIADRVRPTEVTVTNALLRLIEDENITLMVAGAYGHSRLGEWIFGGVTRDLLTASPVCCLFSH